MGKSAKITKINLNLEMLKIFKDYLYDKYIKPELKNQKRNLRNNFLSNVIPRQLHFLNALNNIKEIEGSIAEAGVRNGDSLLFLAGASKSLSMQRKILGFDSFEGFPSDFYQKEDKKKPIPELTKNEAISSIEELFKNAAFTKEEFELIPGYFKESLKNFDPGPIALLHIDVDLGSSYKEALESLYPFVSIGGIILFDEYYLEFTKYKDAKSAIDDYLEGKDFEKFDTGYKKKLAIRKLS